MTCNFVVIFSIVGSNICSQLSYFMLPRCPGCPMWSWLRSRLLYYGRMLQCTSAPSSRCPTNIAGKRPELGKTAVLVVIRVGYRGKDVEVTFLFRILKPRCRTRAGREFFLKFVRGAKHCGHLYGAVTPRSPKNRERLQEKGG